MKKVECFRGKTIIHVIHVFTLKYWVWHVFNLFKRTAADGASDSEQGCALAATMPQIVQHGFESKKLDGLVKCYWSKIIQISESESVASIFIHSPWLLKVASSARHTTWPVEMPRKLVAEEVTYGALEQQLVSELSFSGASWCVDNFWYGLMIWLSKFMYVIYIYTYIM
jgi:hypothetical protein